MPVLRSPWPPCHLVLALLLAAGALSGCAEEAPAARPLPPDEPASQWDLKALGSLPKPVREFTTGQGLRVLVLEEGRGPAPAPDEVFDFEIEGRLRSGAVFMPRRIFPRQRLQLDADTGLPGFSETLVGIRAHERRLVLVPWTKGYGESSPAMTVPPNADLIFDVTHRKLEVQDLVEGFGAEAALDEEIVVHYRGTLKDGTVFDDSRVNNKGKPLTFVLQAPRRGGGGLIEGWVRGLPGMKVGGTRRLLVPAHLGYGAAGSPNGKVPPGAELTFVVELLEVK
jgi:FKBP-type peptidyl-prolyl cis-trans isomerase